MTHKLKVITDVYKRLIRYLFNMKNLIKKILKEESEWWEDTIKEFNPSSAEVFLFNLIKSLELVPSEIMDGWTLYKKGDDILMADDIDSEDEEFDEEFESDPFLFVDYRRLWFSLEKDFNLTDEEIESLFIKVLDKAYKRKVNGATYCDIRRMLRSEFN